MEADEIQEAKCAVLAACADMLEASIIETDIREKDFRYFKARRHPVCMIRHILQKIEANESPNGRPRRSMRDW